MSWQQKPINNHEKLIIIIKSYAERIPPSIISKQIGKTVGSIKKFYSRWKLDKDLPPKEKKSRCLIDGEWGKRTESKGWPLPIDRRRMESVPWIKLFGRMKCVLLLTQITGVLQYRQAL
jgi:hypothetical protein